VVWRVNGAVDPVWTLPAGTRARAQLLNVSNTSYLSLTWPNARQVGGQQGLLAAETKVEGLLLPPGGRAEVEVDAGAGEVEVTTAMWTDAGGAAYGEPRRLLSVSTGDTPVSPLDFSFSNAVPTADPGWTDLVYTFQGGGDAGDWLINGESWPDVTPQVVEQGASVVVEARNLSETSHPFHLHGNRLQLLSTDGVPPERAVYADTLDVPIRSTLRMLLVAENPGEWALHCHILGHEDHGMMTVLRVE
jgi:FtsP/CotA-like multicopper oxidase with cupredoxin domain